MSSANYFYIPQRFSVIIGGSCEITSHIAPTVSLLCYFTKAACDNRFQAQIQRLGPWVFLDTFKTTIVICGNVCYFYKISSLWWR